VLNVRHRNCNKKYTIKLLFEKKGNFDPKFPRYILSCKKADSMRLVPFRVMGSCIELKPSEQIELNFVTNEFDFSRTFCSVRTKTATKIYNLLS